jgi:mono/diheme cytochrome c family protein
MVQIRNRSSSIDMKRSTSAHRPVPPWILAGCILPWVCFAGTAADTVDESKLPPPAKGEVDFSRDIRPILETSCLRCHGPERSKSGFRLDNRVSALKGGDHGVDILPGQSGKSPLIHNVAGLVEDMQMPPPGKGDRLTPAQIGLLRAWIDQGAAWSTNAPTNNLSFSLSPTYGYNAVSGNTRKFREQTGQLEGQNGGLNQFEMSGTNAPDTKYLFSGHALENDYKLSLSADRNNVGFIHSGWDQYRKYYSDTGGFFPPESSGAPNYGRDLFLDIGKAWIDFGLTLPNWPKMTLGYEYDYRQGQESTTDWNVPAAGSLHANAPAAKNLNEEVHVIKFNLDHEIGGVTIEDRFRGEFYNLKTHYTNLDARGGNPLESASEGNSYFQGANTFRLERKFNDWVYGSAGYLYSQLNSDATFMDSVNKPAPFLDTVPHITLEKESHVFNINGLLGPCEGLSLTAGLQADWTTQHGFSGGKALLNPVYTNGLASPPVSLPPVSTVLDSDYDQSTVTEEAALRYNKIPFTALFLEARLQQESIGQYDSDFQPSSSPASGFAQNTDFTSHLTDFRAGFNTSPWRAVSLDAHYRRYENDSHYLNDPGLPPPSGYPGFIQARDLLTDEVEVKLSWRPSSWLRTAFTYQYLTTRSRVDTDSSPSPAGASLGGGIVAGEYSARVYSLSATMTPCPRLFISTSASYQPSTAVTAAYGFPAVAVYTGQTYTALANSTYVLSQNCDWFVTYSFSSADYAQNNYAFGVPTGMEYHQNALQTGVSRRFGKNVTAQVKYGFFSYDEPFPAAGANNYTAHSVFGTITFQWP